VFSRSRKKKRAPGGGRKPKGEFSHLTSLFAVRMPEDMRKQLETAAAENRRSASQELLRRLSDSFGVAAKGRDPAVRAICFLISELAERIRWPVRPGEYWDSNPFLFRAFKIGVQKLLDGLEPTGNVPALDVLIKRLGEEISKTDRGADDTAWMIRAWRSPRNAGAWAASETLADFYSGPKHHPDRIKKLWGPLVNDPTDKDDDTDLSGIAENIIKSTERTWYGMEQARRDLEISKPRKGNLRKS
jgi:hypothetical protein